MARLVKDLMTRTVVTVPEEAPFRQIVKLLDEYRISALPVVDAGDRLVGIVSEADLLLKEERDDRDLDEPRRSPPFESRRRRIERMKAGGTVARDLMTTPVVTIGPDASAGDAARLMHRQGVKRLPVVWRDGQVLGIVSRRDLLRLFLRSDADIREEIHHEVMERTLWIDRYAVAVQVRDGVVTLRGELDRRSLCSMLVTLVGRVEGVVGVNDRLTYRIDDSDVRPRGVPLELIVTGIRT